MFKGKGKYLIWFGVVEVGVGEIPEMCDLGNSLVASPN